MAISIKTPEDIEKMRVAGRLAAEVLEKGAAALNPRGERYSPSTIREKLTMRDFMDTMRASGVQTGGPDSLSQRDRQQFAAELDKWLLEVKRRTA